MIEREASTDVRVHVVGYACLTLKCPANVPASAIPALKLVNNMTFLEGRQDILSQVKSMRRAVHNV